MTGAAPLPHPWIAVACLWSLAEADMAFPNSEVRAAARQLITALDRLPFDLIPPAGQLPAGAEDIDRTVKAARRELENHMTQPGVQGDLWLAIGRAHAAALVWSHVRSERRAKASRDSTDGPQIQRTKERGRREHH